MDGLFKAPLFIIGAIGATVSVLRSGRRPDGWRDWAKTFLIILSGSMVTNFLTPLIMSLTPALKSFEYGSAMLIGLFGISIISAILNVLSKLNTDFFGTIKSFKDVFKR